MKTSPKDRVDIINAYESELATMIDLASRYGMTRQGIFKILKGAGIDTSKHLVPVTCSACGNEIMRHKSRIRNSKNLFCNYECYYAYLEAGAGQGPYIENRHGQRIARSKVSQYVDLQPGNVVHHEDRNCLNNQLHNLRVFANQGDHIRYHRLGSDYAQPIWDGSKY